MGGGDAKAGVSFSVFVVNGGSEWRVVDVDRNVEKFDRTEEIDVVPEISRAG